jgi:hypothetical protein
MTDNEAGELKMQPTIHQEKQPNICPGLRSNVLWVAFSIPPNSLSLVKYPV